MKLTKYVTNLYLENLKKQSKILKSYEPYFNLCLTYLI